jgi:hypothetical protein
MTKEAKKYSEKCAQFLVKIATKLRTRPHLFQPYKINQNSYITASKNRMILIKDKTNGILISVALVMK